MQDTQESRDYKNKGYGQRNRTINNRYSYEGQGKYSRGYKNNKGDTNRRPSDKKLSKSILYVIQDCCKDVDVEFMNWAVKHQEFLETLSRTGYYFRVENGPPVAYITYVHKQDRTKTIEQAVYKNNYLMHKDPDTKILLTSALAYVCDLSAEQLSTEYVPQSIHDLLLQKEYFSERAGRVSRVTYLCNKYKSTEPKFCNWLTDCKKFIDPILEDAMVKGMGVKVNLEKLDTFKMFRLKPQYIHFAKRRKWIVIINGVLEQLPVQILARHCKKHYVLKGDEEEVPLFTADGYAGVYDRFLDSYYDLTE